MKVLICIPTYNEAESIGPLLHEIFGLGLNFEILVIDDNSTDGTGKIVQEAKSRYPKLHLLTREGKLGLASAYLAGFQYGLSHGYDYIGEMDADFSHPPQSLKVVHDIIHKQRPGFIVGSRYVTGGATKNWPFWRQLISAGGSWYARTILGVPIRDLTGGYNFWSSESLKRMNLKSCISDGYVFQIELKYRALLRHITYVEFPILFEERRAGQSKISRRIVLEAIYKVWILRHHRERLLAPEAPVEAPLGPH
jgi:dolichol-phosphate mannosyltransferase